MPEQDLIGTPLVARAVQRAVAALAAGRLVVVVDDPDRENEADLVGAASLMDEATMAFVVRHTTGIVCTPMTEERCEQLRLPLMVGENTELHGTAFTISVDHASTTTGVSARDRAATVRALCDPATMAADLRRPGHIFPLRYRRGGVLKRAGHTEAAVDLLRLAGLPEVGVISELVSDDGSMMSGQDVRAFAARHDLPMLSVADLIRYRRHTEQLVVRSGSANLPTEYGEFRSVAYRSVLDDTEHLALVMGEVADADVASARGGVLTRVHSECLTGDTIASLRCDCGAQLQGALRMIAAEGRGVLVYLRGQEGRGIGLGHKLRAYDLQESGFDTVDANTELNLPVDSREYGIGAQILADLGVHRLRLITNNPAKVGGIEGYGLSIVERVPMPTRVTAQNVRYLRTKRDRMGHLLDLPTEATP